MSAVRPEYGPTLSELTAPWVGRLPRWLRLVAVALVVLAVVALLTLRAQHAAGLLKTAVVRSDPSFNLAFRDGLRRVPPPAGYRLALEAKAGPSQSFVVRDLRLPAYRGDVSAAFLVAATNAITEMEKADPAFVYRGEGRARINLLPGYQISFQTLRDGKRVLGKRFFLVPDPTDSQPTPRIGADVTLENVRSPVVFNVDAVGNNGLLKTPLRSFRFGTQRP